MDKKRQWEIDRVVPRELPEAPVVNQPDWQKTVVAQRVTRDKLYGKQFELPVRKAKKSWTYRRKLVRGASIPVKGSK